MCQVPKFANSPVQALIHDTIAATRTFSDAITQDNDVGRREVSSKLIHMSFICTYTLLGTSDTQYSVPIHPSRDNGNRD